MDSVFNPPHYAGTKIDCITAMENQLGVGITVGFCLGNSFKYLWRAGDKGANTLEEDLMKAKWYFSKYKDLIQKFYDKTDNSEK